jgi:hypothetical protein
VRPGPKVVLNVVNRPLPLTAEGSVWSEPVPFFNRWLTYDLTPWFRWGQSPTRAWEQGLSAGLMTQEGLYKKGPVTEPTGRGLEYIWGVGHYSTSTG